LSIKEGDVVVFEERGGEVFIRRVRNFFDFEGTLPTMRMTDREMLEKAMEEMAKEAIGDV